jgi:hypothetical protein
VITKTIIIIITTVMLSRGEAIFCSVSTRDSGSPMCETNPPNKKFWKYQQNYIFIDIE